MEDNLYPITEPFHSGHLQVSDLHQIYFEEVGKSDGVPVVFLHGGPGGGISPSHRQYFDPHFYRTVLFDQRGCGKSLPFAELRENTTWDLVEDIEKLRKHLGIEQWIVFGGSWGSTLALTYAQTHPNRVKALALRGIFMCRAKEIKWFYQEGASKIYPDAFEKYLAPIPEEERSDLVMAYYKRLTSEDPQVRNEAARAWSVWEASTSRLSPDLSLIQDHDEDHFALAFARIECHFFINKIWMESDDQILQNIDRIRHIPCEIVHGRYDVVCPIENAYELHKAWPESTLHISQEAGHSSKEPQTQKTLVEMMERFKQI
ncbi:MAG: prolyl aminopeptidase [Bdellovibrionaceae bacterium]|nr:prolyl aminopeptidase [Pseudobdellovibrionaceae bacterium]|tara:strand:- start:2328 stop:3278 length:951 start_codon:yes stop_codon:yes gene_type:complete